MSKLNQFDLYYAVSRLPRELKVLLEQPQWHGKVFIAGGYLRATIAREKINDVDLFTTDNDHKNALLDNLSKIYKDCRVFSTKNASTICRSVDIQLIHRWYFEKPEDVALSFDFTVCCAVLYLNAETKTWDSFVCDGFYEDLAAKRLVYRSPQRNEDAGGSMLRVLKFYDKGYRIPLDSLGAVIARLTTGLNFDKSDIQDEPTRAKVLTGLLYEVDPNANPANRPYFQAKKDIENLTDSVDATTILPTSQTDKLEERGGTADPFFQRTTGVGHTS